MEDLSGKRKRKVQSCPNPLFVHWLTEWKNDAAEKGLKTQFVYGKALKTLLRYPLQMRSGKECGILAFCGAKICDMLDKKLDEYIALYGTTEPLPGIIDEKLCRSAQGEPRPKKAKPAPKKNTEGQDNSTTPARKTPKKNSPYMPMYRSGPYALILTLNVKLKDGIPWMSKRDVMIEAQPLADASFTVPDPGSRYTAWSSMGSLISKGYVVKDGNPAKYGLTPEGISLAERIVDHKYVDEEQENGMGYLDSSCRNEIVPDLPVLSNQDLVNRPSVAEVQRINPPSKKSYNHTLAKPAVHDLSDSEDDELLTSVPLAARLAPNVHPISNNEDTEARNATPDCSTMSSVPKIFQFSFVDDSGKEVQTKDSAAVTVDEEISVGFLIKCDFNDLISSGKRYKLIPGRSCSNTVTAYMHNDDIPEVCPDPAAAGPARSSIPAAKPVVTSTQAKTVPTHIQQSKSNSVPPERKVTKALSSSGHQVTLSAIIGETSSSRAPVSANLFSRPVSHSSSLPDHSSQDTLQSLSQDSTESYTSDLSEPDFQFLPGTFDIVLCIDNHEQYGKGKFNRQTLGNELHDNGIPYDVRLLQVGDFLWIARPKGHRLAADQKQELVLDYVIERKRIDDMASSIIDGRFKEQKFRLKSCGLGVPMLLVEDLPNSYCSIPHKSLMQAATNTQVIDKFQIVKTKDLKDSFSFLINMTKFLQRTYQYKTLKAYSKAALQSNNVTNSPQDSEVKLMTFPDFNKGSAKVKPLSVKEAFARQLVCICGITPEKVAVILGEYPTPASLRLAYQECGSENDKEMLLSQLKMPKTNKRIVMPQVSKHIYRLMTAPEDYGNL